MEDNAFLPITDSKEMKSLLDELPLVVDGEQFIDFDGGRPGTR